MGSSSARFCCGRGELFPFLHLRGLLWPSPGAHVASGFMVMAPQAATGIPGTAEVNESADPTGPSARPINLRHLEK